MIYEGSLINNILNYYSNFNKKIFALHFKQSPHIRNAFISSVHLTIYF